MNRCIKNGMLFCGMIAQMLVYAAEKTSVQSVDLAAVADAQLKEKVARYFSNRRSAVQPHNLKPVDNNRSAAEDTATQYFSFRYTKQPERAPQPSAHAGLDNSSQAQ